MVVLPTHRLFRALPAMSSAEMIARLGDAFTTRVAGEGPDLADTAWSEIEEADEQGTLGLYTAADDRWVMATITDAGRARLAQVASDHSQPWRDLGVSILHRLVIDTLLASPDLPKPRYVHRIEEVVEGLQTGAFPLAALGDAGHARLHPIDQSPPRAHAGQEHVLLSEAAQRPGHQPARVGALWAPESARKRWCAQRTLRTIPTLAPRFT